MKTSTLPSHRVLVVDDARTATEMLGKLLQTCGQEVRTTNDASSALEEARRMRPDIIFSDIGMPHVNGYDLAESLRHEPGLEQTVLVAVTGYGQESDKQRAKSAGFDFHLVKPASLEALENILANVPARPDIHPDAGPPAEQH